MTTETDERVKTTWTRYQAFVQRAENAAKLGGDVQRAQVWATLAQAEATALLVRFGQPEPAL